MVWQNQFASSGLGVVGAQVIEAPAALGAVQRGRSRHVGAVEDRVQLQRPMQLVRVARAQVLEISRISAKRRWPISILRRDLRRLQVVVDEAPRLELHLVRRERRPARRVGASTLSRSAATSAQSYIGRSILGAIRGRIPPAMPPFTKAPSM